MPYREGDEEISAECKILFDRPDKKAILVEWTLGGESWVPRSQITRDYEPDRDGVCMLYFTEWWAKKEGVI